jgi:hypothetical protein
MQRRMISMMFIALVLAFAMASTGQATTLAVNATADNEFHMYLNTNPGVAGTEILNGNNWGYTYTAIAAPLIAAPTQYLQVYGFNSGGPASFIGDFTLSDTGFKFANGTQYMASTLGPM